MPLEASLLSCTNYTDLLKHLEMRPSPYMALGSIVGEETIWIQGTEEAFDLERVTLHVNALASRVGLSEREIADGGGVCVLVEEFWTQVGEELEKLQCTASLFYKCQHAGRLLYSDYNPMWIDFWSRHGVMLKGSWGVFEARRKLNALSKKC